MSADDRPEPAYVLAADPDLWDEGQMHAEADLGPLPDDDRSHEEKLDEMADWDGGDPDCLECLDDGSVTTPMGHERGCPKCPRGEAYERDLARRDAAWNRLHDEDGTGQDMEAAGF